MSTFFILCCCSMFLLSSASPIDSWETYKQTFGKTYPAEEDQWRYETFFLPRKQMIDAHNKRFEEGKESYALKLTKMTDWSDEELSVIMPKETMVDSAEATKPQSIDLSSLPPSIDWRKKGAVTHVKDQKHCGSCFAFAAVAAIEGSAAIAGHKLANYSEQQVVDCDKGCGDEGCYGGFPHEVMDYVMRPARTLLGCGLMTSEDYPYTHVMGNCKFDASKAAIHLNGFVAHSMNSEEEMAKMIQKGPFTIAIHANMQWKHFKKGVFKGPCAQNMLNHAVTVVGFVNASKDGPYWIVKNSWGTTFGLDGYINMAFGNNTCGLRTLIAQPIINKV